jgi:WhiB family transcriptional regulator, redox-sensing transcriptional regulator
MAPRFGRHRPYLRGAQAGAEFVLPPVAAIESALPLEAISWQKNALCREMDPELFFNDPEAPTSLDEARRACDLCPVRERCLDWALDSFNSDDDQHGIFGGVGPRVRENLRKARRLEVAA